MPLHATKMVKYLLFRSDFFCLIALWTLCCYGPKYSWKKSVFFLFPPSSFLKSDLPFRWNRCSVVPFFCKRCWTHNRPFFPSFFLCQLVLLILQSYSFYQGDDVEIEKIPIEFKRAETLFHSRVRIRWTYQPKNASNSNALESPYYLSLKSPLNDKKDAF